MWRSDVWIPRELGWGVEELGDLDWHVYTTDIHEEVKVAQSCPTLCDPVDFSPPGFLVYGDSPGKNTGVDCHALLQAIFLPRDQSQVSCIVGGFFTI